MTLSDFYQTPRNEILAKAVFEAVEKGYEFNENLPNRKRAEEKIRKWRERNQDIPRIDFLKQFLSDWYFKYEVPVDY